MSEDSPKVSGDRVPFRQTREFDAPLRLWHASRKDAQPTCIRSRGSRGCSRCYFSLLLAAGASTRFLAHLLRA